MTKKVTTTKDLARQWVKDLIAMNYKTGWLLVIRDLSTDLIYPQDVRAEDDIIEVVRDYYRGGAEEVVEVYDLSIPIEPQLKTNKAWSI